jgi:hypothetical protein
MCRKRRLPAFVKLSSTDKFSKALCLQLFTLFVMPGWLHAQPSSVYYPDRTGEWESRRAGDVGMNAESLQKAVDFALAHECSGPRDMRVAIANSFGRNSQGAPS